MLYYTLHRWEGVGIEDCMHIEFEYNKIRKTSQKYDHCNLVP